VGHKFLRIDLNVNPGATPNGWNVHLGSIACGVMGTNEPTMECDKPNKPTITLDSFDPAADQVVLDVAALLGDTQLTQDTADTTPGCQSFPDDVNECTDLFPNLGLDFATGECSGDCGDQSAFAAVAK
jgi:hypothetical protein